MKKKESVPSIKKSGYIVTSFIDEGGNSKVYEASHNQKCGKFAVKFVKKKNMTPQQIDNELKINKEIVCDFIIPIIDVVEDVPKEFYCAIIMKKAKGTDLLRLIMAQGSLPEEVSVQVAYAGLKALEYLHENRICHRDIKPDNFFLMDSDINELDIVLGDFGHATHFLENEKMNDYTIGTSLYIAPEILRGEPYDQSVDIWSLGCVLYSCLSGTFAFDDDYSALNGLINFDDECWKYISLEAQDFINSMLQVDPSKRASISYLLGHPWIVNEFIDYQKQHLRRKKEREADANPPEEPKDPYDDFGY